LKKQPEHVAVTLTEEEVVIETEEETKQEVRLGVVLNNNTKLFPYFSIDVVKGEVNEDSSEFVGTVEKLDVSKFIETEDLSENDKLLLQLLRRLQPAEISKFVNRNSPFSGIWENIIHHEEDDLPEDTKTLMLEYLLPRIQKLFGETNSPVLLLPKGKEFKTKNLVHIATTGTFLKPFFELKQQMGMEL
jgi:non-specific serine/threonine protein kinase